MGLKDKLRIHSESRGTYRNNSFIGIGLIVSEISR